MTVPISWYLALAAILFGIGTLGVLNRKSAITAFLSIELMLNSVNINLVAFWRYGENIDQLAGQVFSIFVIAIAAAEAAVGLALIISVYRNRNTINLDELDTLRG